MSNTKTVDYSPELFDAIMAHQAEYLQTGQTVCGSEDPAVITLAETFAAQYPEFQGFAVVRVIDRYVSPWKSDTLLEFSDREPSDEEYALYEALEVD